MDLARILVSYFGAIAAEKVETVQQLWSGYGEIARYRLDYETDTSQPTRIIVKWISPPKQSNHPRGWDSQHGHLRKLGSYLVEACWYQEWASLPNFLPAMPKCYAVLKPNAETAPDDCVIVMSDLDEQGYFVRPERLIPEQTKPCLKWLAQFHGAHVKKAQKGLETDWPDGLWKKGSYWHLSTRQQEFELMQESVLKQAASSLDQRLNSCRFTTVIHGDAKLANFCFTQDGSKVAGVDFQYTGAGCGVRDLAYFLGSALTPEQLKHEYSDLVDYYFSELHIAIEDRSKIDKEFRQNFNQSHAALEEEWRNLLPSAWADFQRFILGWAPKHRKNNAFSQTMTRKALEELNDI